MGADPLLGAVGIFAGNFAPRGWALCDGQLLSINSYSALFSILGTTYGGDGRTTFGLPDLRGRVPIHAGSGPGIGSYKLGARGGYPTETLILNQIPQHNHHLQAQSAAGNISNPQGGVLADTSAFDFEYSNQSPNVTMSDKAISYAGGSQPHNNMQPYLTLNYCIAMVGVYPSRS